MESDSVYYRRRASEQLQAAALARDAELRRRHLELAELLGTLSSRMTAKGR